MYASNATSIINDVYCVTVSEGQDDDEPQAKSYYLREHKPRVNLYEAPPIGEWACLADDLVSGVVAAEAVSDD